MTRTKEPGPNDLTTAVRMLARLTRVVEQACQAVGLSLPQYRLLLFVARRPQRAGEVATKAAVSRPALTGLVDGLEKKGLLSRKAVAGDRRGISLELTEEGILALARAEEYLTGQLAQLEERAGAPGLVDALAAMSEGFEQADRARATAES